MHRRGVSGIRVSAGRTCSVCVLSGGAASLPSARASCTALLLPLSKGLNADRATRSTHTQGSDSHSPQNACADVQLQQNPPATYEIHHRRHHTRRRIYQEGIGGNMRCNLQCASRKRPARNTIGSKQIDAYIPPIAHPRKRCGVACLHELACTRRHPSRSGVANKLLQVRTSFGSLLGVQMAAITKRQGWAASANDSWHLSGPFGSRLQRDIHEHLRGQPTCTARPEAHARTRAKQHASTPISVSVSSRPHASCRQARTVDTIDWSGAIDSSFAHRAFPSSHFALTSIAFSLTLACRLQCMNLTGSLYVLESSGRHKS